MSGAVPAGRIALPAVPRARLGNFAERRPSAGFAAIGNLGDAAPPPARQDGGNGPGERPRRRERAERETTVATALAITGRGERSGRTVLRLAAAAMLVLLGLGATIQVAGAAVAGTPGTKDDFILGCRAGGGRVVDLGDIVRCDEPDLKSSLICSWSLNQCWVVEFTFSEEMGWLFSGTQPDLPPLYPDPDVQPSGTHGEVGGGVAADDGETSGASRPVRVGPATTTGTILALDEDDDE